jgi:hypothetical protein
MTTPPTDPRENELYNRLESIGQACWENREQQRELSARIRAGVAATNDIRDLEILREFAAAKQAEGDRVYEQWLEHLADQPPGYRLWKIGFNVDPQGDPIPWADRICHKHNFNRWVEWLAQLTDEYNSRPAEEVNDE